MLCLTRTPVNGKVPCTMLKVMMMMIHVSTIGTRLQHLALKTPFQRITCPATPL